MTTGHEDQLDGCCDVCGSIWHATADHPPPRATALLGVPELLEQDFPKGYDPSRADRLIGRHVDG